MQVTIKKTVRKILPKTMMEALVYLKATLNKPTKISAQTWMTQVFGILCL